MSVLDGESEITGNGWHECAGWLIRCGALRADHKANWPQATAADLALILRDGVLLCNLLNSIEPGCIDSKDVNQKPQMAQFLCLRNINAFLSACTGAFGLPESDLFEPSMLFDLTNFHKVLCTLSVLSCSAPFKNKKIEGFTVKRGRSQEDIYKDLQSTGVGKENQHRSRWRRRATAAREPDEEDLDDDDDEVEEDYDPLSVQPHIEEIYHDLCSLRLTHSLPPATQGAAAAAAAAADSESEKRDYVIQELVETERNYTEVLNSLLRDFARPLMSVMPAEEWTRIFFGIKELAEIHAGFLSQLRKARGNAPALSQVFLDWREKFLIYGDYCANLTSAQSALNDICASNDHVNEEVIKCQQKANNGKFKLRDILSVPMQRVLKYHLLLDKLVEETPREWTEDRLPLQQAREVMVDVAQYINEVKRDTDTLDIIKDIQLSIVDWGDRSEDIQLKNYGRLLKDGDLKVKAHGDQRIKSRYVFIFEQVVLVCKAGRGEQYCFRELIKLEDYRLEDPTNRKTLGRDSRSFQWLLVTKKGDKVYTLYARTEEFKMSWMKALQTAIDNLYPPAVRNTDHKYRLTTFERPETCSVCFKFLKGRIFQGFKCETCNTSIHKECIVRAGRCSPAPPPPPPPPPSSLLPAERELSAKLWYVGEMSRDAATQKLLPRDNGTYLVRIRLALGHQRNVGENETPYALSVKAEGEVKHMKILKRKMEGADLYYLSDSRFFKSIITLIEYYERHSLEENFDGLDQRLLWPFRRVLAKALYNYQTEEHNQLSLRKGCRVVVLSKEGDDKGWWKGKIGDQVGFFPKVYVEEE